MKMTAIRLASLAAFAGSAAAGLHVTEFMYSGEGDEFAEITNTGTVDIDVTGWTYETASAGSYDISAFGTIRAGESVIITQGNDSFFRSTWDLDGSVKIIADLANTLARNDTITIRNAIGEIVDQIAYGDGDFDGTPRARSDTLNVPSFALGLNDPFASVSSSVGDEFGSYLSNEFDVGNPGFYYAIPAPSVLGVLGLGAIAGRRRRA